MGVHAPRPRLPLYLAAAYTLLALYASLHPFSGWRDSGAPPLDYLTAAWPRYFTTFDLVVNAIAYVPLGFLWVPALQRGRTARLQALLATLICIVLSFTMETVQNYLPSRVPSNLDLGSNSLGGLVGALLGARWGRTLLSGGRLHSLRVQHIVAGGSGEAGLMLLGLWLLTQLNPETLLFGSGDLRHLLDIEIALDFDTERFSRIEAVIAAAKMLALGLFASCLLRPTPRARGRKLWMIGGLLFAALAIRSFAAALLVAPEKSLHWLTPGNGSGLAIGIVLLAITLRLPSAWRRALAGSALLLATVLVNLAPENPYLSEAASIWRHGHFLNFNGLTRLVSVLWPFLALPWLLIRERDPWTTSKH
ncbi:MAG: VanZ family protein [Rhodocyclaceae bacterium]|nr:VanZ family protein [Rhodocyclaceae bacterium]